MSCKKEEFIIVKDNTGVYKIAWAPNENHKYALVLCDPFFSRNGEQSNHFSTYEEADKALDELCGVKPLSDNEIIKELKILQVIKKMEEIRK